VHVFTFGESEVRDLVEPLMDEDVRGLEVAVDDVEFSQITEPLADLPEHVQYLLLPLLHILLVRIQEIPEIAASAILGDNVEEAIVLDGLKHT
jgi:hypothetical protein